MAAHDKALVIIDRIGSELKLLWGQLDMYQELYLVEQDKRLQLISETAPGFFALLQVSLIESMLMRVFRLMDSAQMRGHDNFSFEALRYALLDGQDDVSGSFHTSDFVKCLEQLRDSWKPSESEYQTLKRIRDKDLAHNDWRQHSERNADQLWMALTDVEFEQARSLASRLWAIYRQAKLALTGNDVVEPKQSRLIDRPSMLLKHLCASLYLDQLLGNEHWQHGAEIDAFELQKMGEDQSRHVFTDHLRCAP